ncbi:MAG: hypothetical protein M1836_006361 [Candelina mexicana]|nr:MAG: hypothetical protein M1836_006361 [Candelina mexicana]
MRPRLPNTEGKEYCSPIPQGKKRQYRRSTKSAPPEALQDEGNCWFVGPLWGHHICNNQDSFVEYTNTSDNAFGLPVVGMGTVRLYAILQDRSVKVLDLTNVQHVPEAPTNSFSLLAAIKAGISWNPKRFRFQDSFTNAIMAWAPLVNGRLQLQLAAVTPPLVPEAHCGSVANEPASEARSTIAATESFSSSSSEDRSAIAAFSDFETSLSEAHNDVANLYAHSRALPALVQGGEASPRAPDAPEQDTSSVEGLLDEKDHNVKKPSLLEASEALASPGITSHGKPSSLEATEALALPGTASRFAVTEALAMPGTTIGEHGIPCGGVLSDSSSAVCSAGKPFSLEAVKALASPGTTAVCCVDDDVKKPSQLEAAEALVLPGTIYEQDHCDEHGLPCGGVLSNSSSAVCSVDRCDNKKPSRLEATEALVSPGTTELIRSSRYNQLQTGLARSAGQIVAIRKSTAMVAITPSNRKSTTVAITIRQLAATRTSYGLFDPEGSTPQDFLSLLLLLPPCLFDWHLRKPALRQRPPPPLLLGTEDINGHWVDMEGVSQATAGGGGMAKELGIPAIAVPHSMAMATAGWSSYGYSTLAVDSRTAITIEQCTPYGGATPRKPSLFGGTRFNSTPYGGATQQKPSRRGNRKSTASVAVTRWLFAGRNGLSFDPGGTRPPSPPQSIPLAAPFDPGGLSSSQSWLINLPCCLLLATAVSTPCLAVCYAQQLFLQLASLMASCLAH